MTKTIKGNLVLEKNTEFDESIIVEGSILCKTEFGFSLKVAGDINAWDINAGDINASFILCNLLKVESKVIAYSVVKDRLKFTEKKNWNGKKGKKEE